jgi:type II secretion system (T2SS) protein E
MAMPSLEDLITQSNLVSAADLANARREAESHHRPLAQSLIALGLVTDRRFAEWIAEATKLPLVDPVLPDAVTDVEQYLTRAIAREYEVVPIDVNADELTVAMVNPLDETCRNALQAATGMKIHAVVGVHGQLKQLVDRFYPADAPTAGAFDPSATMIAARPDGPFQFGTETLLRSQNAPLEFERGEESIGTDTRQIPMPLPDPAAAPAATAAPAPPESQLDRIEKQLSDLVRHIDSLQRRIEAIDGTLARMISRK